MDLHALPTPSSRSIATALGCFLVVYLVTRTWLTYRRLRHFPGPFLGSISYLYMFRNCCTGAHGLSYANLNRDYNSRLVRIGPNDLITDDPEILKRMNAARSPYARSSWYRAMRLDPYKPALTTVMDTKAHEQLKAKLSFGYRGKDVPDLEVGIDEQIKTLIDVIRSKYASPMTTQAQGEAQELRLLDFAKLSQYLTLDVITRLAYGKAFGYLEMEKDVGGYIGMAAMVMPVLGMAGEIALVGRTISSAWMLKLFGPKPTDKTGLGLIQKIAGDLCRERFKPGAEEKQDMLGSFIRHGVSREECEGEIPFQIMAGSDTTATTIRTTLLYLMTYSHAYRRLQDEIDQAVANGNISDPIETEEGKALEYLQAVIYEGLRLSNPFTGLIMKKVPPEGDHIDGMFIPGGTRIGHNMVGVQHSEAIWGPDHQLFRPERWLGQTPERLRELTTTTEMNFGNGRWACLGKSVAFTQLSKVIVQLLRNFDFQLVNPLHPWDGNDYLIPIQTNMWLKVTDRKTKM